MAALLLYMPVAHETRQDAHSWPAASIDFETPLRRELPSCECDIQYADSSLPLRFAGIYWHAVPL
jgi:hypothetical protein